MLVEHLRCHVALCAAVAQLQCLGRTREACLIGAVSCGEDTGESKVDQAAVAVAVEHHIIGLDVAMDDATGVEELDREDQLGGVKPRYQGHDRSPTLPALGGMNRRIGRLRFVAGYLATSSLIMAISCMWKKSSPSTWDALSQHT